MKTYRVTAHRNVIQEHSFEIEAVDKAEARELAEDEILGIADDAWEAGSLLDDPAIDAVVELSDGEEDEHETEESNEPAEPEAA